MKTKLFVLAIAMAAGTAFADNQIVDNLAGTFVDISAMGANTLVNNLRVDDSAFSITTSVTNSVFTATNVSICSNGFVQFGTAAGAADYTNAAIQAGAVSPVAPGNVQALFPFWDDQFIPVGNGGEIYWMEAPAATFGLPAARGNVLIIEWKNVPHYDLGNPVGAVTYQVQVFQNVVGGVAAQVLYSDMSFDDPRFDNGISATVGFAAGNTGGPGSYSNVSYAFNGGGITDGLVLSVLANTSPTPPSATAASASPASAIPGDTVLYTVTVAPGANPVSTGLAVHGDLTAVGGSASAVFHDDGLNGDAAAADGVFSFSYVIPAATTGGNYSVPVTITDGQSRSGSTAITGNVFNPTDLGQIGAGAGGTEVVTTVDVPVAAGEIVWYKFSVGTDVLQGSTNYLDIDTEPSADDGAPAVGSINDTEIGVYHTDGSFIVSSFYTSFDDDSGSNYHSQLSFGDNSNVRPAFGNGTVGDGRNGDMSAGTYFLATGLFNVTFAPNFVVTGTSTASGTFQVNFRTNIPGGGAGSVCGAADVGGVGGVAGADNHLDNNDFVVFIDLFFNHNAIADMGSTGGTPGADGAWDNNDFVVFIDNFFTAPASCR
jgi:hypothetical protein